MRFISHRGNLIGKNKLKENTLEAIDECISHNLFVEVDLWYAPVGGIYWLGHDRGETEIPNIEDFLDKYGKHIIIHAKNIEAFSRLFQYAHKNIEFFSHNADPCALTYNRWIWLYPGQGPITEGSIVVMPENCSAEYQQEVLEKSKVLKLFGICSDHILAWKSRINGETV